MSSDSDCRFHCRAVKSQQLQKRSDHRSALRYSFIIYLRDLRNILSLGWTNIDVRDRFIRIGSVRKFNVTLPHCCTEGTSLLLGKLFLDIFFFEFGSMLCIKALLVIPLLGNCVRIKNVPSTLACAVCSTRARVNGSLGKRRVS